jgi:hypothetical protein
MMSLRSWKFLVASSIALGPRPALAQSTAARENTRDRFELSARSETYAELFRRALLPGANGALVSSDTVAPIYQYVFIRASNLDTPWRKDSVDFELAAWGRGWLGARDAEQPFDGDIQVANARYRQGPLSLRIGRQQLAGGAARFVRFDGANLAAELGAGLDANAYAGWTVLPRWNERRRYEQLGAAAEVVPDATTLEAVSRGQYWLAGGRVGWSGSERRAGLSFHEQREPGGIARRNLGLDARLPLVKSAVVGSTALLDLDRGRFADARLWLDLSPAPFADLSVELLHTEPALFLSHQSVLSVFGSAEYEEAGGYGTVRANRALAFDASAFAQVYRGGRPGARTEVSARSFVDAARTTFVRLAYARVLSPDNGYHSLRSSLSRRFLPRLSATLEAYAYLYDRAIRNYRASTVYAGTLSFEPTNRLSLLWGASLAHSPYANLDAQTTLRVAYAFELVPAEGAR